jgi:hypothetical protein
MATSIRKIVEYHLKQTGTISADTKRSKASIDDLAVAAGAAGAAIGVASAAITALAAAAVAAANEVASTVDTVNTLAQASGTSAEFINGLRLAASATGKELKDLVPPDLAKRIEQTREGTGRAREGFKLMGLEAAIMRGELATSEEVYLASIDALMGMEDPTLRAAAATMAFGEQGKQMLSAFSDRGDLEAFIEQSREFGIQVGPEAMEATLAWQRATAALTLSIEHMTAAITPLIPMMAEMVEFAAAAGVGLTSGLAANLEALTSDFIAARGNAVEVFKLQGIRFLREGAEGADAFSTSMEGLSDELDTATAKFDALRHAEGEANDLVLQGADDIAELAAALGYEGSVVQDLTKNKKDEAAARKSAADATRREAEAAKELHRQKQLQASEAFTGAGVTTLKFTDDLATNIQAAVDDLAKALEPVVEQMEKAQAENKPNDPVYQSLLEQQRAMTEGPIRLLGVGIGEISALLGPVGAAASSLANLPGTLEALTATIGALPSVIVDLPDLFIGLIESIVGLPASLIERMPEIIQAVLSAMVDIAFLNFELFAGLFDLIPGKVGDAVAEAIRGLLGELNPFDGDGSFLGIKGAGKTGDNDLFGLDIPFFNGGGNVTETGLAVVHKGERVQTEQQQRGGGGGITINGPIHMHGVQDPRAFLRELAKVTGPFGTSGGMLGAGSAGMGG